MAHRINVSVLRNAAPAIAAVGLALALCAPAQAVEQRPHHRHVQVHAHRVAPAAPVLPEYLDSSTSAAVGTEDRYSYETIHDTDPGLVHPFGSFGESALPSRFSAPGQEPLFRF